MARTKPKQGINKNLIIIGAVLLAIVAAVIAYGYVASQKNKALAEQAAAYNAQKEAKAKAEANRVAELKRKVESQQQAWGKKSSEQLAAEQAQERESRTVKSVVADDPRLREITSNRLARDWVKASLKDPESAEFRNERGLCGEVNSKNGFGGYTGFKRYAATENLVAIEGENISSTEMDEVWQKACQ